MTSAVSVVLCVRNGEAYIRDALDSIAAQNMENIETIVVDDGSEDQTAEIARAHRVGAQVISRPPLGVPASLNAGVEIATKELVAFLDADDVWPSTRLCEMVRFLDSNPAVEIVYGQMVNTDQSLRHKHAPFAARHLTCSVLRRSALAAVGPFRTDVAHASNVDWMSRALAMKIPMAQLDALVLLRRVHGENMGVRDASRGRRDLLRVIRDHRARSKHG
jgi:glycosyltransferase involved in cell wall biosynthesis